MTAALFAVTAPIVHPLMADCGQFIAWYSGRDVVVLEENGEDWQVVRRLHRDAAEAVCALHVHGVLRLVSARGDTPETSMSARPQLQLIT